MKFYFDFISPYAYLAWQKLRGTVEPVPVLLAAILNATGQKGPAEIPAKRVYTMKNIARLAHDHGIPMAPPPSHPFNPLLALRVAILDPSFIDPIFHAVWRDGIGVETPEKLAQIGVPKELIERAPEAKELLKRNTEYAIEKGVFGVPTMEVDGELFWGFDSLAHLQRFIQGEDPLDKDTVERWLTLPASASRV
jgi:2-hydroxychromene-2-carboxylate isomerase